MTTERVDPKANGDEREMLEGYLDFHRATLALKCQGLEASEAAQRSTPPSALSLLGIVRHMTDVESIWFVSRFEGGAAEFLYRSPDGPDLAFSDLDHPDLEVALRGWNAACVRSREVLAKVHSLDQLSIGTRRDKQHFTARWMLNHMMQEYARHNGHADLLREAIDGTVGM